MVADWELGNIKELKLGFCGMGNQGGVGGTGSGSPKVTGPWSEIVLAPGRGQEVEA